MKAFHTLQTGNHKLNHRGSGIQKDYTYMDQEEQNKLTKGAAVQVKNVIGNLSAISQENAVASEELKEGIFLNLRNKEQLHK